jgi:alpha-L-rhamnosidase
MDMEIPPNTTATIYIPAASADEVKEGNNMLSKVIGIKVSGKEDNYVVVEVGLGKYHFTAPYSRSDNNASEMM